MSRLCLSTPVLLVFVLWPDQAIAQQDQGTIAGRVTDATGALIPRAAVTASAIDTGISTQTLTNSEGLYALAALKIGRYRMSVEIPGFKRGVSDVVEVHAQDRVRVDFELSLGSLDEAVSVLAVAPLLETDTSSLGRVIRKDQIPELPLNGRNFQQLAILAAGVLPAFGHLDRAGGFNSHGQWATQNNFILDGVDNNSQVFGLQDGKAQVVIPNLDAVQEFKLETANYSAEFGRSAGAVMNVSLKSGTNELRGTVYEFLRNDIFDARDAFSYNDRTGDGKADADVLHNNQYGFTIGGPLRKNRTFYFLSAEITRIHTTESNLVTVPTLLERDGIFDPRVVVVIRDPANGRPFPGNIIPRDRWDPVAAQLLSLWPEPNFAGTTRANFVSASKHDRLRYQYDARADHNASAGDRFFVRVSRLDFQRERHGPLPPPAVGAVDNDVSRDENGGLNVAVSETHIFGSTLVNETRFGFNRLATDKRPLTDGSPNEHFGLRVSSPEPVDGLARLTFGGQFGYVALGDATFNPNDKVARTFQVLDNVSILRGHHAVKVGADLRWIESDIVGAPQTRGVFNFNGTFTGSSFGDFLLGWTSTRQISTLHHGALRERDYMGYVQDDWRLSSRLTLNLGLRYELASPMFDTQDRMTTLDMSTFPAVRVIRAGERGESWSDRALVDTDTNNWAPRVGFAFQHASRWTVGAAIGMFYGTPKAQAANLRLINNWPYYRDVLKRSTATESAGQLASGIDASLLGGTAEMPDDVNWNVWAKDFKLPAVYQWNLSVQRQIGSSIAVTTAYVGSSSNHLPRWYNINGADPGDPRTERQRRPIPRLGAITYRETSGRADYHGLEATLDKRLSRGIQLALAYTWSHSIDDVLEQFGAEREVIQDTRNLQGDRGNSGFDRRHRLVGSYVIELPFGDGRRWLGDRGFAGIALGGWQFSGIVSMQSGAYFDVSISPTTRLGVTGPVQWRPDLVGDPGVVNPGPERWLNPAAFAVPQNADGSYRFGNLGRNTLLGPGFFNVDAALMRDVHLGDRRRLQIRWEVFNATNQPSYGLPNSTLGDPDFGTIRTTISTPRQMQFGIKFVF